MMLNEVSQTDEQKQAHNMQEICFPKNVEAQHFNTGGYTWR